MKTIPQLIIFILLFTGCPTNTDDFDPDTTIVLKNISEIDIVELRVVNQLPTSSPFKEELFLELATIKTDSEKSISEEEESIKKNRFRIFFFSRSTINNNSWETIIEENLILQQSDLTLENLVNMNWTVVYDGNN